MNILTSDKFPYLLTILFGLCTWSLTRIVNDLLDSSVVEYSEKFVAIKNDSGNIYYKISNISRQVIDTLTFKLAYFAEADGKITDAAIITYPPAFKENISWMNDPDKNEYARYIIGQLQPGWTYILQATIIGKSRPKLFFVAPKNVTVNLQMAGFKTYLVKNQDRIILGLLATWVVLILIYLITLTNKPEIKHIKDDEYLL